MTIAGQLERIGRGLYRLPEQAGLQHESLATVATKVPQAVFCLLTALQFHELTTQLPRQVWIAMPRGSHVPRIDYPPVRMVQASGEAFTAGIELVQSDQISATRGLDAGDAEGCGLSRRLSGHPTGASPCCHQHGEHATVP